MQRFDHVDAFNAYARYRLDLICPPGGSRGFGVSRTRGDSKSFVGCGDLHGGFIVTVSRDDKKGHRFVERSQFEELMDRMRLLSLDHVRTVKYDFLQEDGELYFVRVLDESGEVRSVFMQPRDDPEFVGVADGLDDLIDAVEQMFPPEGWFPRILSALRGLFRGRNAPHEAGAR